MNYVKIKLLGGAEVHVDMDSRQTSCKRCGKVIRFGITKNSKQIPIIKTEKGWQSHFADCEFADEFRKPTREDQIEAMEKNQEMLNEL